MEDEKRRFWNLRFRARTRNLKVSKSKMVISKYNQGKYMVMDRYTNQILFGENYSATLEEIENFVDNYGK